MHSAIICILIEWFNTLTISNLLAVKGLFLCRFVYLELPAAAKTPCTRFRWWQPVFSGEEYDQWAVDDIIILSEKQKQVIPVVNPTLPQVCLMWNSGPEEEWRMTGFLKNLVSDRELGRVSLVNITPTFILWLFPSAVRKSSPGLLVHWWFRHEKDCEV